MVYINHPEIDPNIPFAEAAPVFPAPALEFD